MPYFTTADLRALPDMSDTARFPDARLTAAHDWIVGIIERECETSFISVPTTEILNGTGRADLMLSAPYILAITAVSVDGVAFTSDQLAGLVMQNGVLYSAAGSTWSQASRANVTVTYNAGYSTAPPADLKEAALRGARNWLLTSDAWSGKDSRATSITNDFGNINLTVASEDHPTGLPDVDATIMSWARRVRVPKVS